VLERQAKDGQRLARTLRPMVEEQLGSS
jgi:hypothetical protein